MSEHVALPVQGGKVGADASERAGLWRWSTSQGWVFSPKLDLLVFGGPFVFGWSMMLLHELIGLDDIMLSNRSIYTLLFAGVTFLDMGHVLSTIFKTYLDPEERARRRFLLYCVPLLVIATNLAVFFMFGKSVAVYLFRYFNYYHIMRQQYGWMRITARKARENGPIDRWFDAVVVYGALIIPAVWMHVSLEPDGKRVPFGRDPELAQSCATLFIAIAVSYLTYQLYKVMSGKPINVAKMLIAYSSLALWGLVMFTSSPFVELTAMTGHAVPYIAIVYITQKKKQMAGRPHPRIFGLRHAALWYTAAVGLMGYGWIKVLKSVAGKDLLGIPFDILFIVVMVVSMMHYIIDGVVWRAKSFDAARDV